MKIRIVLAVLLAGAVSRGPATAHAAQKSDGDIQEAIHEILMQRHPADTGEWWKALGPSAPRIIIEMYGESQHIYHRLRLLGALGWFDDPAAVDFLKAQAASSTEDVIRNTAIHAIGASQGVKEEDYLAKFLKHDDPQTRLAAAETLKRLNDSRADTIVEKYLTEEKVSWIAQRLKGELPKPTGLAPPASSEDRLVPAYSGTWRGYWIAPKSGSATAMQSQQLILHLRIVGTSELRGDLVVGSKGKLRTFNLTRVTGKSSRAAGALLEVLPQGVIKATEHTFSAEISEQLDSTLLEIKVPGLGAVLLARRDPSSSGRD